MDDPKLGSDLSEVGSTLAKEHHSTEANFALTKFFELCITACTGGLDDVLKVSYDAFKIAETVEEISWGAQSGFVSFSSCLSFSKLLQKWLGLTSILKGFDKDSNENHLEEIKTFNRKCSREFESDLLACIEQIPLFLYGATENFSPSFLLDGFEEITFSRLIVFFTKALIHFFKGQYQEAAEQINESDDVIDDCFGTPFYMFYKWFSFIILSSFYEKYDDLMATKNQKKSKLSIMEVMLGPNAKAPKTMKEKTLERILEHEKDILDLHAKYPHLMAAARSMCSAEVTKLHNGDKDEVIELYVNAYEVAVNQNMHLYAGLIQNRLCDFCVSNEIETKFIKSYAENAIKTWKICGAHAMVSKLNEQYKDVLTLEVGDSPEFENIVPIDSIPLSIVLSKQTQSFLSFSNCDRLGIFVKEPNTKEFILLCEKEKGHEVEIFDELELSQADFKFSIKSLKICLNCKNPVIISNAAGSDYTRNQVSDCEYLQQNKNVKEQMIIPLIGESILRGAIVFESSVEETFNKNMLNNTKALVDTLIDGLIIQNEQFRAQRKLVPLESLKQLGKDAGSVQLGDHAIKKATIMCLELRNFTEIIESGLSFVNLLIGTISPIIENLGGFIENCTGPKIVAVFTNSSSKAVSASLDIVKALRDLGKNVNSKATPSIGIGIHSGSCSFGVVGSSQMFSIMYSESFSMCLELTKLSNSLGAIVVLTQDVLDSLNAQELKFKSRKLGKFIFENKKTHPYSLFEISGPDWIEYSNDISKNISQQVEECIDFFSKKKFDKVLTITEGLEKTVRDKFDNNPSLLGSLPHLKLIQMYRDQSKRNMSVTSLLGDWCGEISIDHSGNPQHLFEQSITSEQVQVTPKANEVNEDIEKKLRSLQTQLEQLKSENENLRSIAKNEDSGMGCFCMPSRKKIHPTNK